MNGREVIPTSVKLGIMADRVVFALYQMEGSLNGSRGELDLTALQKAYNFMQDALKGREQVVSGALMGRDVVETISAFSQVLATLEAIYRKKSDKEKQEINAQGLSTFLNKYKAAIDEVIAYAKQQRPTVGKGSLQLMIGFFQSVRDVALADSASASEVVVGV